MHRSAITPEPPKRAASLNAGILDDDQAAVTTANIP